MIVKHKSWSEIAAQTKTRNLKKIAHFLCYSYKYSKLEFRPFNSDSSAMPSAVCQLAPFKDINYSKFDKYR